MFVFILPSLTNQFEQEFNRTRTLVLSIQSGGGYKKVESCAKTVLSLIKDHTLFGERLSTHMNNLSRR